MTYDNKPVTLKTLAKILKLNPSTISKALRDGTDISENTRNIVKQKAEELGYQPNIMARTLIKKHSNIIGVIVSDLRISFFSEVTRGIYEKARQFDYETIIMVHNGDNELEKRNLKFLAALNVDGILIDIVPGSKNKELLKNINNRGVPVVCYDSTVDELEISSVRNDDEKASYDVVEYLINNGRKDIVFLCNIVNIKYVKYRYNGYQKALADNGIEFRPDYVIACNFNWDDVNLKMTRFLNSGKKFNGIVCVGGLAAYEAGRAILDYGLLIPKDVLLAEFGDNNIVHRLGVPFVTVNQFPFRMGQKAVEMIVDIINDNAKEQPEEHIFIDTKLIHHHHDFKK
ncbi:LacI family DNA-binding transcriptional regulator [candidate division KSB1 bacterium]|nr:LacI family DNA-binding transcriptional regulator [candidate division KSB1 bacterium]